MVVPIINKNSQNSKIEEVTGYIAIGADGVAVVPNKIWTNYDSLILYFAEHGGYDGYTMVFGNDVSGRFVVELQDDEDEIAAESKSNTGFTYEPMENCTHEVPRKKGTL